ncbi:MAG: ABC transporter ATP-binding protein [Bacillota bacterium]|nr:ABC transporter ATP-binding protein [Bacillota bacterium]
MMKIKNLSKRFGTKEIFCQLNLNFESGKVFALIGPNGAGKTTLMRMIMGWDKDYEGEIICRDDIRLGYSPETPWFPEILTGRQVLSFYLEVRGTDRKTTASESARLMQEVGLDLEKDTLVRNYSKGMRQRLGVAQALIGDPDLLLLDEPSAGLDFFGQVQMQTLIAELKTQGKTIILNSHLLHDVEKVADAGYLFMNAHVFRHFDKSEFEKESLADMFINTAKGATDEGLY